MILIPKQWLSKSIWQQPDSCSLVRVAAAVLLWLLHQKGLFDPLYDWWEDHIWTPERSGEIRKHHRDSELSLIHFKKHHRHDKKHHKNDARRRTTHHEDRRNHLTGENDYHYYLHHVHKDNKHKHRRHKSLGISHEHVQLGRVEDNHERHYGRRKERSHDIDHWAYMGTNNHV